MRSLVIGLFLLVAIGCSSDKKDNANAGDGGPNGSGSGTGSGTGSGSGTGGSGSGSGSGTGGSGSGSGSNLDGGGTGTGGTAAGPGGMFDPTGIVDGGFTIPDELMLCGGPCACADGMDNDGDGVADGFDTECTGLNDNDEGSFATGIPGDNRDPKWQDCFFDGNSGAGDDGCRYATECLTGDLAQSDPDCVLSQQCIEFCAARTPNGCDCFGCCTIPTDTGNVSVILSATCDADDISTCATCTPTDQCGNTCGECELCLGKTVSDLPESCFDMPGDPPGTGGTGTGGTGTGGTGTGGTGTGTGGSPPPPPVVCDGGARVCGSHADCGAGYYCWQACCLLIPPD
jgi:hypothetical protein